MSKYKLGLELAKLRPTKELSPLKTPMPPPRTSDLFAAATADGSDRLSKLVQHIHPSVEATDEYLPWDKIRYKTPPGDLSHGEWWLAIKLTRNGMRRQLPFEDKGGEPFVYALPDSVLRSIEKINRDAGGTISISEQVTNPATRDRYLVNSLIEEATTSSQLEGASTTGAVAKEMIRSGRPPIDRSEQMIYNNYIAMRRVIEVADKDFTPELVCEIHRIVTEDTLDDPTAAGRLQTPDEERVAIRKNNSEEVLHYPPPAEQLPARLKALCDFANGNTGDTYVPPVLRALTIHFMVGYDHYFEDGNGRTARALFYWSMLRQGFWLTEFLSVSRILKKAPAQYARSFLLAEDDENDLTHFFLYHLLVFERAIAELHVYLARKMEEVREFQQSVAFMPSKFNHRQIALLEHGMKNANASYTTLSHSSSHNVSGETARKDLQALERLGLMVRGKNSYSYVWTPAPDLAGALKKLR